MDSLEQLVAAHATRMAKGRVKYLAGEQNDGAAERLTELDKHLRDLGYKTNNSQQPPAATERMPQDSTTDSGRVDSGGGSELVREAGEVGAG